MMKDELFPYWHGLWHPPTMASNYDRERYLLLKGNSVKVWNSFQPVQIDEPINWNMDPFENNTWGLYFNSLNWLYSYYWGFDNGVEDYRKVHHFVTDYCRYLKQGEVNEMAWFDHSTSDRLCFLSSLFTHPMFDYFPENSKELIIEVTFLHISKIREFFDSKFWFESNHGVFHALSILNISQIHPFSRSEYGLEGFGLTYLQTSLGNIISMDDAFTLEQSVYYHQLAIDLLETIPESMLEKISFQKDAKNLLPKMIENNYWVTLDDKRMIPLGDTSYEANIPEKYLPVNVASEKFKHFSHCGFSIYKSLEDNQQFDHISFLHQTKKAAHGHFDALSVTISQNNTPLIIDSGGPYKYENQFRFAYFMSNRGHNSLILDGKIHQSNAFNVQHSTPFHGVFHISASHKGYLPAIVSREIFIFESHGVLIIDYIDNITKPTKIESLWHLAPDCTLEEHKNKFTISSSKTQIEMFCSDFEHIVKTVQSGIEGDTPQGWITSSIGERIPSDTLVATLHTEESKSLGWFFSFDQKNDFSLNDSEFEIEFRSKKISISFENRTQGSKFKIS